MKKTHHFLFAALSVMILFGAGCAKKEKPAPPSPPPSPREGVIQQVPVPQDLREAEKRAKESGGGPISESETPPPTSPPWSEPAVSQTTPTTGVNLETKCKDIKNVVQAQGYKFEVRSATALTCNVGGPERDKIVGVDVLQFACGTLSWEYFKNQQQTLFGQKEVPGPALSGVTQYFYSPGQISSGYLHFQTPDRCIYSLTISGFGNFPPADKQLNLLQALGKAIIPLLSN